MPHSLPAPPLAAQHSCSKLMPASTAEVTACSSAALGDEEASSRRDRSRANNCVQQTHPISQLDASGPRAEEAPSCASGLKHVSWPGLLLRCRGSENEIEPEIAAPAGPELVAISSLGALQLLGQGHDGND